MKGEIMDKSMQKENWICIMEFIDNAQQYGVKQQIDTELDYKPDYRSFEIPGMPKTRASKRLYTSGWERTQYLETDMELRWFPFRLEGQVYLIPNMTMRIPIRLRGLEGLRNGARILKEIAHLYDCISLGATGLIGTEECHEILRALPYELIPVDGYQILMRVIPEIRYVEIAYCIQDSDGTRTKEFHEGKLYIKNYTGFGPDIEEFTNTYRIFPLVMLPDNIFVDVSKVGKGPLPIKRGVNTGVSSEDKEKLKAIASGKTEFDGAILAEMLLKVIEAIEGH